VHTAILLDEFDPSYVDIKWINMLCDRYPATLECKGAERTVTSKLIYILSNIDPTTWYASEPPTVRAAFFRRISKIYHVQPASSSSATSVSAHIAALSSEVPSGVDLPEAL
jgi:hypothetical protein